MWLMISFAITVHNEGDYLQTLLNELIPFCHNSGDEIVILDDFSTDELTTSLLSAYSEDSVVSVYQKKFEGNFSDHKNYLNQQCSGDYIFQIDADERLHPILLNNIGSILEANPEIDLFLVPRINTVDGLTQEDINRWGWRVNEKGWVVFPDYQTRIYRNRPNEIMWKNKVHERIMGHKTQANLPAEEEWCIIHEKTIERQRAQNEYYESL